MCKFLTMSGQFRAARGNTAAVQTARTGGGLLVRKVIPCEGFGFYLNPLMNASSTGLQMHFDGIFLFGGRGQHHGWQGPARAIQEVHVGKDHRRKKN